jgi:hypothetical protein
MCVIFYEGPIVLNSSVSIASLNLAVTTQIIDHWQLWDTETDLQCSTALAANHSGIHTCNVVYYTYDFLHLGLASDLHD